MTASWMYSYDGASNRTKQVRSGNTGAAAGTTDYTYNDANQITSATGQSTTWTYDGAGQQTRKGLVVQTMAYNDRLQATSIGSTAQTYIGAGNTDRRTSGNTTFQTGALGLMKAGNTVYTRTPDSTAIGTRGTAVSYFITDHLGSIIGIFTNTGAYLGGYSYSPYGESRAVGTNATVTANILRYIGGELDSSGLHKLGKRYYDAQLGRFTQPDPSGQEKNPYGYASCNPINSADPSGLKSYGLADAAFSCASGATIAGVTAAATGIFTFGASIAGSAIVGCISAVALDSVAAYYLSDAEERGIKHIGLLHTLQKLR